MSLVYLYSLRLPVALSETNNRAPNFSRPMYNYPVRLYQNNHNVIDFVVRNNDRKPVKLHDCLIDVLISRAETGETMLEKRGMVTDEIKGRAQVVITAQECESWPLGGYRYQVRITRHAQPSEFLFVDVNNNSIGEFTLERHVGSVLVPSQEILAAQFTPMTLNWDDLTRYGYYTGAIKAENQVGSNTGMYTVVVYTANKWKGWFRVQASLDNLAPTEKSWFDIKIEYSQTRIYFDGTHSTPALYNFVTNARWIRFFYQNHDDNTGEFIKVSYKIS